MNTSIRVAFFGFFFLQGFASLRAYSHVISNTGTVPLRVTLYSTGGGSFGLPFKSATIEPSQKVTIPGNFLQRILVIEASYRGSDPRYSGLVARWEPRATPPSSTTVNVYDTRLKADPDQEEDFFGNPVSRLNPERHTDIVLLVNEFQ